MVHEDYKEMLALQALEALEDADVRAFEEHLSSCVECQTELADLRDAAGLMAYAAAQAEPPAVLRSQILENVRRESLGERTGPRQLPAESNVIPLARPGRPRWSFVQRFGAIAAALAFVALLASLFSLWNRNAALQREISQLSSQTTEQQRALAREKEIVAMLTARDAIRLELTGTPMAQKAHAMLAYDRNTGQAMLMVEGLPAAPADKAYQLWFIAEGKPPMPGKVFTTDTSGRAMMSDEVPAEARQHAVFAVTLEPKGGVRAPTGEMYLRSAAS